MYDLTALLLHSTDVPEAVKAELVLARSDAPSREAHLRSAARELVRATALDCGAARELVGLPAGRC
jgi:hypothetical protein